MRGWLLCWCWWISDFVCVWGCRTSDTVPISHVGALCSSLAGLLTYLSSDTLLFSSILRALLSRFTPFRLPRVSLCLEYFAVADVHLTELNLVPSLLSLFAQPNYITTVYNSTNISTAFLTLVGYLGLGTRHGYIAFG